MSMKDAGKKIMALNRAIRALEDNRRLAEEAKLGVANKSLS